MYAILLQVSLDGFSKASETGIVNAILVSLVLILFGGVVFLFKKYEESKKENKVSTEDFNKKIQEIQKLYNDEVLKLVSVYNERIESIQNSAIKREEERSKQWLESEKETLTVLNGVTSILDIAEKMDQTNRNTVYLKLQEMENRILSKIESIEKRKN
ncbi:MAG: hypothetical protein HC836_44835 [Richelia sp. RM2_1_2]|nr:hypothetical protein [Richelia sp. RM2_1_2]